MKRILMGALLASAIAFPAMAALKQGDTAPDFKAKASLAGKAYNFSLKSALKKGPVVVYFYPSAYTGGCNAEAHAFAESKEKFDAVHATIIGVSGNSIDTLNAFSADAQYCAGKFPVASDADGAIAKAFNLSARDAKELLAARPGMKDSRGEAIDASVFIERTTFVITPDSKIVATFTSENTADDKIRPDEHADKSLALVEGLATKKN